MGVYCAGTKERKLETAGERQEAEQLRPGTRHLCPHLCELRHELPLSVTKAPLPPIISYWAPSGASESKFPTGEGQGLQRMVPWAGLGSCWPDSCPGSRAEPLVPPDVARLVGLSVREWKALCVRASFLGRGLEQRVKYKETSLIHGFAFRGFCYPPSTRVRKY